ncbi:PEP-CTERM sorting domain-containing protein [Aerosakkonema sp. BLCC-F183]|uniref:PEP-CTERM sorting domain-containing protein n=1 Tax=Aerosakkonema sp. BLCC-F183 TaxID=3342834 RepID=UPI0035B7DFD5
MPSRQYSLLGLAITLVVTLTGQSGVAFTINYPPPDGRSNAFIRYNEPDYEGEAYLVVAEEIERGGTNKLWQLLNDFSNRYPGRWEFRRAENDLQGSFDLLNYYICGPQTTDCGAEIGIPVSGGVGSLLDLRYYPALLPPGDPLPDPTGITRRVQWIQRVYSNHSLNPDRHGSIENVLDIDIGQTTPYYSGVAGNGFGVPPYRFFGDRPYRVDPVESHFWDAELYLVEEAQVIGSQKRTVTIYNGMKWGWRNNSRRKSTCNGSSGGGGCFTVTATNTNTLTNRELPLSDFDSGDPNQSAERVPEPTTILGLLALGAAGTIQMLKNKFTKQQ